MVRRLYFWEFSSLHRAIECPVLCILGTNLYNCRDSPLIEILSFGQCHSSTLLLHLGWDNICCLPITWWNILYLVWKHVKILTSKCPPWDLLKTVNDKTTWCIFLHIIIYFEKTIVEIFVILLFTAITLSLNYPFGSIVFFCNFWSLYLNSYKTFKIKTKFLSLLLFIFYSFCGFICLPLYLLLNLVEKYYIISLLYAYGMYHLLNVM